jgi:ABC-2 type transport system permease protein
MKPFAYEWVRIRTLRSSWVLSAVGVLLAGLVGAAGTSSALSGGRAPESLTAEQFVRALRDGSTSLLPVLMAVLGAMAFGHEYRHGTIRPALTALPRRVRFATAKVVVAMAWATGAAVLAIVAALAGAAVRLGGSLPSSWVDVTAVRVLSLCVAHVALWAALGAGLGALIRSQVAAIVTLLVWGFVAEPILTAILHLDALASLSGVSDRFPVAASRAMTEFGSPGEFRGFERSLGWLAASVTFTVTVSAICALGTARFVRRDA